MFAINYDPWLWTNSLYCVGYFCSPVFIFCPRKLGAVYDIIMLPAPILRMVPIEILSSGTEYYTKDIIINWTINQLKPAL